MVELASGMKSRGASQRLAPVARRDEPATVPGALRRGAAREASPRLLAWTLSLSALAHLAFTPLAGLLGLMAWLLAPPPEPDIEAEQLHSIPILLLSDEEVDQLEAASAPPPAASAPAVVLPSERAGAAAPAAPRPAPPRPKPVREAPQKPVATQPRTTPEDIAHPVAVSGVKSEVIDSNANVNLLLVTERIRNHPLGPRIGKLIVEFPQWRSFFESGAIDPVRDLDRILVVGPQFRRSADVVALLHHDLPPAVMRAAVDRLVRRPPKGRWLHSEVPAARAHADRAERLFALTAPHVLVVAPPHLERQLLSAPPTSFPLPKGDEAVVLHVKTPWRSLIGLPFRLPQSIQWLRLDVLPLEDGSVQVRITAEDADPRQAAEHARGLSDALNALTNPDLGALGALVGLRSIAFIDRIEFQARGARISGQVRVTPRQLERLLVYAEELVRSWTGRRASPGASPRAPGATVPRSSSGLAPARRERAAPRPE